jgi:hypothetical protein
MNSPASQSVSVHIECVERRTSKAILVRQESHGTTVRAWLPLSQIEIGERGTMVGPKPVVEMPAWLARRSDLQVAA